ncbi:MAG: hypothetical protein LBK71_12565, partial [Verrucomicrobiales bacterium]|nr:hypothetical protein [Verrucomicrobiales bacterium]
VPAFQRSSVPAFQRSSVPAFQRSSVPAFQRSSVLNNAEVSVSGTASGFFPVFLGVAGGRRPAALGIAVVPGSGDLAVIKLQWRKCYE